MAKRQESQENGKRGRRKLTPEEIAARAAETTHDRFVRVGGMRAAKVRQSLKALIRCANREQYAYDVSQVERILKMLKGNLARIEKAFMEGLKIKNAPKKPSKKGAVTKLVNFFAE